MFELTEIFIKLAKLMALWFIVDALYKIVEKL